MINNFEKNHKNNIHPSVTIEASAVIDKGASIGANTKIWHWVHICSKAKIGKNCSFGQNVFVANKVKIGNNVKIGGGSGVIRDIADNEIVMGYPAIPFKEFVKSWKK